MSAGRWSKSEMSCCKFYPTLYIFQKWNRKYDWIKWDWFAMMMIWVNFNASSAFESLHNPCSFICKVEAPLSLADHNHHSHHHHCHHIRSCGFGLFFGGHYTTHKNVWQMWNTRDQNGNLTMKLKYSAWLMWQTWRERHDKCDRCWWAPKIIGLMGRGWE